MKSLLERAREVHKRRKEHAKKQFVWKIQDMLSSLVGHTDFLIYDRRPEYVYAVVEGVVIYCIHDYYSDEPILKIVRKCPECGEIYGVVFDSLAILGAIVDDVGEDACCNKCGHGLVLLDAENAKLELDNEIKRRKKEQEKITELKGDSK